MHIWLAGSRGKGQELSSVFITGLALVDLGEAAQLRSIEPQRNDGVAAPRLGLGDDARDGVVAAAVEHRGEPAQLAAGNGLEDHAEAGGPVAGADGEAVDGAEGADHARNGFNSTTTTQSNCLFILLSLGRILLSHAHLRTEALMLRGQIASECQIVGAGERQLRLRRQTCSTIGPLFTGKAAHDYGGRNSYRQDGGHEQDMHPLIRRQ
ncbi:hypothetical protein BN1708_013904 [Verticillium longisporum]|uniref:Uncharacterized protein n=1 Tax=Verticillium longisporum TaxID=100787 RepID=A0A0G4LQU8_VERLO|nr:hypothetical protein BN1708_013904 [Verticillium longisporum]